MIGYLRVSTSDQDLGIDAQRAAIQRVHPDPIWIEDKASGKNIDRPGLAYALSLLDSGAHDSIVVSHLDRLSRSVLDFATLLARAEAGGWNVIVLDLGLDMTTPRSRFTAHVMAAAAELERSLIGMRTREALAAAKARGQRLGRPPSTPEHVTARVVRERAAGATFQAIADGLNADGVPTAATALCWSRGLVAALVRRAA